MKEAFSSKQSIHARSLVLADFAGRFDILCTREFPFQPPIVRLRTTGGGQIRFNPNLKSDGKGIYFCYTRINFMNVDLW